MPARRQPRSLEEFCKANLCQIFARACESLEMAHHRTKAVISLRTAEESPERTASKDMGDLEKSENEFRRIIAELPARLLEEMLPRTIRTVADKIRENRSNKGLLKSLECLISPYLERLDLEDLFRTAGRLYGDVNSQCKRILRNNLRRMRNLTYLNLSSKCDDATLVEVARNCHRLEELHVPLSDITDTGLLAVCGISLTPECNLTPDDGCMNLRKLGVINCFNIRPAGVGSCLRNLPNLSVLSYEKLVDAIETVVVIDGDYLRGSKKFLIKHLDQFNEYYDFVMHPLVIHLLLRVCPRLESLRFCTSDDGCKHLSQLPNIHHLHLETEDLANGFRLLIRNFSSLVSLQLQFRKMPFSQMIDIADCLPSLEVLRLEGLGVENSHNLKPNEGCFRKLRVVEVRLVCQEDPFHLLNFLLSFSYGIQDIQVSAVSQMFNARFFLNLLVLNPMRKVERLILNISPNTSLNLEVARTLLESLPSLRVFGVITTKWNMNQKDISDLVSEVKKQNYHVSLV